MKGIYRKELVFPVSDELSILIVERPNLLKPVEETYLNLVDAFEDNPNYRVSHLDGMVKIEAIDDHAHFELRFGDESTVTTSTMILIVTEEEDRDSSVVDTFEKYPDAETLIYFRTDDVRGFGSQDQIADLLQWYSRL